MKLLFENLLRQNFRFGRMRVKTSSAVDTK